MDYKLIGLDLDNTLLNRDKKIDSEVIDLVKEAKERGFKIILATGRMYETAVNFAKELDLEDPLLTYNGALVKDIYGKEYYKDSLSLDLTREILAFAEEHGLHIQYYHEGNYYYRWENDYARNYADKINHPGIATTQKLSEYIKEPAVKLLIIEENKQRKEYYQDYLKKYYGHRLNITSSIEYFIEITAANITKGYTLARLAGEMGIDREEVVVVGDNYNDLEMIEWAGLGIAMENAPEEVRARADRITSDNNNRGVAKVLEYLLSCNEDRD
ncbi:MAG: Cof-type HAD-IIB family hydrolase [Bacillota bacterium]